MQTGVVLTVSVDAPESNTVQITDQGSLAVQVAWNGGRAQSFTGVVEVIVDARRAHNDQMTFIESIP